MNFESSFPNAAARHLLFAAALVALASCVEGQSTSDFGQKTDTDTDSSTDAGMIGDECPDDPIKTKPGECGCGISDQDYDADGTLDCRDKCPRDPKKVTPGICGCGTPDDDSDGDGTPDCLDKCPDDPQKTNPGVCGCGTPDNDADGDETPGCIDKCPDDPQKTNPGVCGCGTPDDDADGDGTPDCNDPCPDDPQKTNPGVCGCGTPDTGADADSDSVVDCLDLCEEDPFKTEPGICGCGVADDDIDGDDIPDCNDLCPSDPQKTSPGVCGCHVPDEDSDGDGTIDCIDQCPNDPHKTTPAVCGCGESEEDSDGDGTHDCIDGCPSDPQKTTPGMCDCGVPDNDSDGDGAPDCIDGCPSDPEKTAPGAAGCGGIQASCAEILQNDPAATDGTYEIDPDGPGGIEPFEVVCDMTSDGGGWTLIAHVHKKAGMPTPGCAATGGDPGALGYSIDASGIAFSEIAVTHNGLTQGAFASFPLDSQTTFDCSQGDIVFLQSNGRYSVLFLSDASSEGWGDISLACFNSTSAACTFQSRSDTFGAVATGGGNCQQLDDGDGVATSCGAWGLAPSAGDTTWTATGGRILIR